MMKNRSKYQNSHTKEFTENYPEHVVETTNIASFVKFNFDFLDVNQTDAGFDRLDCLDDKNRLMLLEKIKEFSGASRFDWESNRRLVIYENIPRGSKAKHPKHVPSDVCWARFRLEGGFRLIGFFIPDSLDKKSYKLSGREYLFDRNTFYAVFLDPNHNFYPCKN
jgi:hypothetical protein